MGRSRAHRLRVVGHRMTRHSRRQHASWERCTRGAPLPWGNSYAIPIGHRSDANASADAFDSHAAARAAPCARCARCCFQSSAGLSASSVPSPRPPRAPSRPASSPERAAAPPDSRLLARTAPARCAQGGAQRQRLRAFDSNQHRCIGASGIAGLNGIAASGINEARGRGTFAPRKCVFQ